MTAAVAEPQPARCVLLIDLSALFWQAWHASGNEAASQAQSKTIESVQRCAGSEGFRLIAVCCDSRKSFRRELDPTYKANRPEKDHASIEQLRQVQERLRADGRLLWEADGYEADDVIAAATKAAVAAGHEVVIASHDKDLVQLAGPSVRFLRTNTWTMFTSTEAAEKFGVMPSQVGDWLALVGDAGDNIKGCEGVGPKKATALLVAFKSLAGIWAALEADKAAVAKLVGNVVAEKLAASIDIVSRARVLVALKDDVPIRFEEIYEERKRKADEEDPDMDVIDIHEVTEPQSAAAQPGAGSAPPPPPANGTGAEPAKALAKVEPTGIESFNEAMLPTDMRGMWWLASRLHASRLYDRYPSKEAILVTMLRGREVGLPPLSALDVFHIIDGKPCPYAYLIIDLATRHPKCEYLRCIETDAAHATWETKHRDHAEPMRLTFTYEEAVKAGLPKTGPRGPNAWLRTPADMCRKSCGAKLGRFVYPGAGLGLTSVEEMGGDSP